MASIAFIQHRLGRTDGVSLEVDKWRRILEGMGHEVHYLAGNEDVPGGNCIPELHPTHPVTNRILRNATRALVDYPDGTALLEEVREHADRIKPAIMLFLKDKAIDLVFPNNLVSVGYNLAGMLALYECLEETGVRAVCHNHDFWWEDSGEVYPTCPEVVAFFERYAPPVLPNVAHMVINRLAQEELRVRKGVQARVVPNVFDFDRPSWKEDAYNADFREAIGLRPDDLFFLQATRVLDRKGIELAIDVIAELNQAQNRRRLESQPLYDGRTFGPESRIVLVCAGYVEIIGLSGSYAEDLAAKARELGVEMIWCGERVGHDRGEADGEKVYALWDSYVAADFVTYPSYWEGWGNQLIEAIYGRLPVLLFEYPVYVSDLREAGFEVVSLGSELGPRDARGLATVPRAKVEDAADRVIDLLQNAEERSRVVEQNFSAARERYSYETLETIIRQVLN